MNAIFICYHSSHTLKGFTNYLHNFFSCSLMTRHEYILGCLSVYFRPTSLLAPNRTYVSLWYLCFLPINQHRPFENSSMYLLFLEQTAEQIFFLIIFLSNLECTKCKTMSKELLWDLNPSSTLYVSRVQDKTEQMF